MTCVLNAHPTSPPKVTSANILPWSNVDDIQASARGLQRSGVLNAGCSCQPLPAMPHYYAKLSNAHHNSCTFSQQEKGLCDGPGCTLHFVSMLSDSADKGHPLGTGSLHIR